MPGKSESRWAAISSSSGTKRSPPSPTGRKRGSTSGTFTRARRRSPVSGSRTHHAEREREVRDVRERPPGADRERRQDGEDACRGTWPRARRARDAATSETGTTAMPRRRELGQQLGEHARSGARRSSRMRVADAVEHLARAAARRPCAGGWARARTASSSSATRTMQNSSRLDEKIAEKRSRSSSGTRSSRGQLEHAGVPLEPRQLAVEEARLLVRPSSRRRTAIRLPPRSVRVRAGAGTSAARRAGRRSARSRAAPALGNETRAPVTACTSAGEVGLVADEHEVVAVALGQPGEIAGLDAEQRRRRRPAARPARRAMISAVSWARGYGLVTTHCGSTLQRRQRPARGARGASPCGHERTLGIGRAERAILGLSVSDEDDCHGVSIDLPPDATEPRSRLVTGSSPNRSPSALTCRSNALVVAILPGVSDVPLRTLQVRPEHESGRPRPAARGVRGASG